MFKFKLIPFTLVVTATLALPVYAGGGGPAGGGATEVTQWLNNSALVKSVGEQTKTTLQLIQTYKTTLDSYVQQVKSAAKLADDTVMGPIRAVNNEINAVNDYIGSLKRAKASFEDLTHDMDVRTVEAKLRNLTIPDYVRRESVKIQNGDARARQRIENEKQMLEKTNTDIQNAVDMSKKITGTDTNQSIQMLNTQMNQMLVQNARMAQMLAYQTGTLEGLKIEAENVAREENKQKMESFEAAHDANRKAQLEDIAAMKAKRGY